MNLPVKSNVEMTVFYLGHRTEREDINFKRKTLINTTKSCMREKSQGQTYYCIGGVIE